jgi:hypothetical protein
MHDHRWSLRMGVEALTRPTKVLPDADTETRPAKFTEGRVSHLRRASRLGAKGFYQRRQHL